MALSLHAELSLHYGVFFPGDAPRRLANVPHLQLLLADLGTRPLCPAAWRGEHRPQVDADGLRAAEAALRARSQPLVLPCLGDPIGVVPWVAAAAPGGPLAPGGFTVCSLGCGVLLPARGANSRALRCPACTAARV